MTEFGGNMKKQDDVAEVIRAVGPRPKPPAGAYDEVLAAATVVWQQKVEQRRRRRFWGRLAAGAAALAVGLGVWFGVVRDSAVAEVATVAAVQGTTRRSAGADWRPLAPQDTLVARSDLETGKGGGVALWLTSGVQLRVAGETQLRLLNANHIELKAGRIYIDSDRHSLGDDLRLVTAFGEIRDIGTQFQVDVDDERLRVRIREGQVLISNPDTRIDGGVGEEIQLDGAGRVSRSAFPTHGSEWAWAEALATPFQGGSLKDFLVWLARETGYILEFDDSRTERLAATVTVSGNQAGFTPEEALEAQRQIAPSFDYEIRDGVIFVFRYPQR